MKCAVSDFDRTLYVDQKVSDTDLAAIGAWQQAGNWFVIATGRNESSVREKAEDYGLCPDAWIFNNGAVVKDKQGNMLVHHRLDDGTLWEILRFLDRQSPTGNGVSTAREKVNITSSTGIQTQKTCDREIPFSQLETIHDAVQIHHRNPENPAWIRGLCDTLNRQYPQISAYANVWNADIVPRGVDKSSAVRWIASHMAAFDQILVIGDSANDIGMIRSFGGAAPAHAEPEVKAAAARIVSGVAELLRGALG